MRKPVMKMKRKLRALVAVTAVSLLLLSGSILWAQTGNGFDLSWSTIDGGGGSSSGGSYALSGTAGQPDAGQMSGGPYSLLSGGFWNEAVTHPERTLFLPLVASK